MSESVKIEKLKTENIGAIVDWCKDKDENFLMQWAGAGYSFPLTEEQIAERLQKGAEIYEAYLDGRMSGTIEIISRNKQRNSALIGRFVIDQSITNKGSGTKIMSAFLEYLKNECNVSEVTLFVFDFNIGAYKCYQKCGFSEEDTAIRPNGWKAIAMKKIL